MVLHHARERCASSLKQARPQVSSRNPAHCIAPPLWLLLDHVGAGIFLDCRNLPVAGRVAAYRSRLDFVRVEGEHWPGDRADGVAADQQMGIHAWMERAGVAAIILTEADYTNAEGYAPGTTNPRTEVRGAKHSSNLGVCACVTVRM